MLGGIAGQGNPEARLGSGVARKVDRPAELLSPFLTGWRKQRSAQSSDSEP